MICDIQVQCICIQSTDQTTACANDISDRITVHALLLNTFSCQRERERDTVTLTRSPQCAQLTLKSVSNSVPSSRLMLHSPKRGLRLTVNHTRADPFTRVTTVVERHETFEQASYTCTYREKLTHTQCNCILLYVKLLTITQSPKRPKTL